jgi:hypothetical protein
VNSEETKRTGPVFQAELHKTAEKIKVCPLPLSMEITRNHPKNEQIMERKLPNLNLIKRNRKGRNSIRFD